MSFLTRYPVEFPSNMSHVFRNVIQVEPFVVEANCNKGCSRGLAFLTRGGRGHSTFYTGYPVSNPGAPGT